jgi:transposase
MSRAYTAGIGCSLPNADITYDHFHLAQLVGNAVDEIRREEVKAGGWQGDLLTGERYTVLRNESTQSEHQAFMARVIAMPALHLKTGKAYRMRLAFQDAMATPGDDGVTALTRWCRWARRCGLPAMKDVAAT